jgi:hypothetical protein
MGSTRRNILLGLGGVVATSGAVVGTGALNAFQAERDADVPVTNDASALVSLSLGSASLDDDIVSVTDGQIGIDFTSNNSDGVQPNATYQLGGIEGAQSQGTVVYDLLDNDNVVDPGGFPSPLGSSSAESDPAIVVGNNSEEVLGVTVNFSPNSDFPSDGRVLLVMHDRGTASGSGEDVRYELYGPSQSPGRTAGAEYRKVYSGQTLGFSMWIYTGSSIPNQDALGGELVFEAQDVDNLNSGEVGDG